MEKIEEKDLDAMNDHNDYMQWFTDGVEYILCNRENWIDMYSCLCSDRAILSKKRVEELSRFRKATKEEIINNFKK